jgi:hypothetical protein
MSDKTSGLRAGDPLAVFSPPEGSPAEEMGVIVLFMTPDQLRRNGTLAVRMWMEKNVPVRPAAMRAGQVLEFGMAPHQAAPLDGS